MADPPRLLLQRVVLDVADYDRSARFWSAALGYDIVHKSDEFWVVRHPTRKDVFPLGLQRSPDAKRDISPLHIELFTDDMAREVARLEALGATRVADWPYPEPEHNWIVMRDPDGHEFCVVEWPAERLDFG